MMPSQFLTSRYDNRRIIDAEVNQVHILVDERDKRFSRDKNGPRDNDSLPESIQTSFVRSTESLTYDWLEVSPVRSILVQCCVEKDYIIGPIKTTGIP
ncbi:predicted protein [Sclerotinia sclerotiorum 1980 UF-70]|uniref:Uncharacterized protein n=1 Tax=Sclerotinia sclerotiorum (strain ATCC 18683 / 1980 / Ss-1) TaxID=665079 RepID=A7ESP4_SCLS1|nr:predicted protein [Sclerotinia sclerotiorum 1980 UF-70]EDN92486.1 predicted protein [Sclerotinia sclerotiorum 1980 UF-70]